MNEEFLDKLIINRVKKKRRLTGGREDMMERVSVEAAATAMN